MSEPKSPSSPAPPEALHTSGNCPKPHQPDVVTSVSSRFGKRGLEAEVWPMYVSAAEAQDTEDLDRWNRSNENFLLFTTLLSAILTAFVVSSVNALQQDYTQTAASALATISAQIFAHSSEGSPLGYLVPPFLPPSSFSPSPAAVWTNALWIISLTISLLATVISTLVKQWLTAYREKLPLEPLKRARVRQFRHLGATHWHMSTIIATLPIAMHISVFLFLSGLVVYLWELCALIAYVVLAITTLGMLNYLYFAVAPLVYLDCPFVSPVTTGLDFVMVSLVRISRWGLSKFPRISKHFPATSRRSWRAIRRTERIREQLEHTKTTDRLDALALGWLQSVSTDRKVKMAVFSALFGCELRDSEAKAIYPHMQRSADHLIIEMLRGNRSGLANSMTTAVELAALSAWSTSWSWKPVRGAVRDLLTSYEASPSLRVFTTLSLLLYSTRPFLSDDERFDAHDIERAASVFVRALPDEHVPSFELSLLLAFFHSWALLKPEDRGDNACVMVRDAIREHLQPVRDSGLGRPLTFRASACAFLRVSDGLPAVKKQLIPAVVATESTNAGDFLAHVLLQIARTFMRVGPPASGHRPELAWVNANDLLASNFGEEYQELSCLSRIDRAAILENNSLLQPLKTIGNMMRAVCARRKAFSILDVVYLCLVMGPDSAGTKGLLLDHMGYAHEVIRLKHLHPLTIAGAHDPDLAHLVTKCLNHVLQSSRAGGSHSGRPTSVSGSGYAYLKTNLIAIHTLWFRMIQTLFSQKAAVPSDHPILPLTVEHVAGLSQLDQDCVMRSGLLQLLRPYVAGISTPAAHTIEVLLGTQPQPQDSHLTQISVGPRSLWRLLNSPRNHSGPQTEEFLSIDLEGGQRTKGPGQTQDYP